MLFLFAISGDKYWVREIPHIHALFFLQGLKPVKAYLAYLENLENSENTDKNIKGFQGIHPTLWTSLQKDNGISEVDPLWPEKASFIFQTSEEYENQLYGINITKADFPNVLVRVYYSLWFS